MANSLPEDYKLLRLIEEYPSPAKKEELSEKISELESRLGLELPSALRNKARVKLADLLVGKNEPGDYQAALRLFSEVLSSSLPTEWEHAVAGLGASELSLKDADSVQISLAISSATGALKFFERDRKSFFYGKARTLLAELMLKRNTEDDRKAALKIFEEIVSDPAAHKYFKMRAAGGRLELLLYFFPDKLKDNAAYQIRECEAALASLKDERPDDYFLMKGMIVLSEAMIFTDRSSFGEKAKDILQDVLNRESAGDDLRARASLDLAEISSPELAKSLIKGVRRIEGLDPYLLRKATSIEQALLRR